MKKIFSIVFAGAVLMSLVACSDESYDEKYTDPSKTSTVGVPQVFTAIQVKGNTWMNPVYYRYYTQSTTSGVFSGIIGSANGKGRFRGASEGYFNTRWMNFYDMLTQYRVLQKTYAELPEQQQNAFKVFDVLGRTMVYAQLHEMMSIWGDVPYTGAGTLWMSGDYANAKSQDVYDDQVETYKNMLNDLKEIGDFLAGSVDATGLSALSRQDLSLAAGDKTKWQKYVNSLRLRIALHLATNGNLTAEAHTHIKDLLENPAKYPLIEANADNQGIAANTANDTFNYGKSYSQALHTGSYATVSQAVLDALHISADGYATEDSDPRVGAMLDPNPDNQYIAYDVTKTEQEISDQASNASKKYVEAGMTSYGYWAQVDSVALKGKAQYDGNENLDGCWMSAAEVALSKAEAYLMGYGVSKDLAKAKAAFVQGVTLSTEFYVNLKFKSSKSVFVKAINYTAEEIKSAKDIVEAEGYAQGTDPEAEEVASKTTDDVKIPSYYNECLQGYTRKVYEGQDLASIVNAAQEYADAIWTPTQECVCTQLWLNHFVFNELEAWNVTRRTGYPSVKFAKDNINANYPTPPNRLPYTSDELTYNKDNVQKAIEKNYKESTGYYTNLFWAKEVYYNIVK